MTSCVVIVLYQQGALALFVYVMEPNERNGGIGVKERGWGGRGKGGRWGRGGKRRRWGRGGEGEKVRGK